MAILIETTSQGSTGMQGNGNQKFTTSSVREEMGGPSTLTTNLETTTTFSDAMCVQSKVCSDTEGLSCVLRLTIRNLTSRKTCLDGANGY